MTFYNFTAPEPIMNVTETRPSVTRPFDGRLTLANLFRAGICSTVAGLRTGMDILEQNEGKMTDSLHVHGGLFKIPGAAQQILSDAFRVPVTVRSSAGEGGAWGMSLLSAYMSEGGGAPLPVWLDRDVFASASSSTLYPDEEGAAGFDAFMRNYTSGLRSFRN